MLRCTVFCPSIGSGTDDPPREYEIRSPLIVGKAETAEIAHEPRRMFHQLHTFACDVLRERYRSHCNISRSRILGTRIWGNRLPIDPLPDHGEVFHFVRPAHGIDCGKVFHFGSSR